MSLTPKSLSVTTPALSVNQIEDLENKLFDNPYFVKFKDRIVSLKESDPEKYMQRLQLMFDQHQAQKKKEAELSKSLDEVTAEQAASASAQPSYVAPKTLDSIMKVERLKNKDAEEIGNIWRKFHAHRSAVFASISQQYWEYFVAIKMHFPVFVYPLPKDDGKWLFYVGQWGGNELNFTSLEHYKLRGPDAPVLLTLCHYPDLVEAKKIVLMVGDVDESLIKREDAQLLAYQVQYFHTEAKGMSLVQVFNSTPQEFKYDDVIKAVETIGQ